MDQISTFTHAYDGERLSGAVAGPAGRATALLLHGAGNGSKERSLPFLADFAGQGCRALAFDFSGHGESTGELADLSLRRRYEQAVAVLDAHAPGDDPLILIGFSMSGQTVADLMRHYGRRVAAVGLCAPAVYGPDAWDVPFGTGDSRFSELIRTPDSWRDSPPLRCSARTRAGRCWRCRATTRSSRRRSPRPYRRRCRSAPGSPASTSRTPNTSWVCGSATTTGTGGSS